MLYILRVMMSASLSLRPRVHPNRSYGTLPTYLNKCTVIVSQAQSVSMYSHPCPLACALMDARMGHFASGWPVGIDPATAMPGTLPLLAQAATTNGSAYCVDPAMYSSVLPGNGMGALPPPAVVEAEAARRRHGEDNAAIRLVRLLITCADAIQAGDYAAATANLDDARVVHSTILTATGISLVTSHFIAGLARRLFPALERPNLLSPVVPPRQSDLYRQFYEAAGPYLMFGHFMANQAIFEAFQDCDRVHIVDLALMQGVQWPAFIQALAIRPGGPPALRITGVGPPPSGGRDELHEVGIRLAEVARSVNVPFSFRGVTGDQLDMLQPWMFQLVPGEAVAVNSILQLHRLLVDPNAASTSLPAPIDVVLSWVASMQPKVFTVVEQEADHNKPALVERFTNALFYYAAVFDSIEAVCTTGTAAAEGYLQNEIFDVVCGEGSGRTERHEPLHRWLGRLRRSGMSQVPLSPCAVIQAASLLHMFPGAGYHVQERAAGCLTLAWHDRPLLSASVWRDALSAVAAAPAGVPEINAAGASVEEGNGKKSSSESSGHAVVGEGGME